MINTKHNYLCRFDQCHESFDHNWKRSRHEEKHIILNHSRHQRLYPCQCCSHPVAFSSAKKRNNHQYFRVNQGNYKCSFCGATCTTHQKLCQHKGKCLKNPMRETGIVERGKKKQGRQKKVKEEALVQDEDYDTQDTLLDFKLSAGVPKRSRCDDCTVLVSGSNHIGLPLDNWHCYKCGYTLCSPGCHSSVKAQRHLSTCAN